MDTKPESFKKISARWLQTFGTDPPKWIESLNLDDVENATSSCKKRIQSLSTRLNQERALVHLLEVDLELHPNVISSSGPDHRAFLQEAPAAIAIECVTSPPSSTKTPSESSVLISRRRVCGQVDRDHESLARRVKDKVKAKHLSLCCSERIFDFEDDNNLLERAKLIIPEEENKNTYFGRRRSKSESSTFVKEGSEARGERSFRNSPSTTLSKIVTQVDSKPLTSDHQERSSPMDIPGKETKRLSNGTHPHLIEDDDNEFVASVKTIVGDDSLGNKGPCQDADPNLTLKRDSFYTNTSGEKTPTDTLTDIFTEEFSPSVDMSQSQNLEIGLFEAGQIAQHRQELSFDDEDEEQSTGDVEETGSFNDMENSGFHSNFQNLAESTLTYILRDTIFASRSNSMSSLNDSRRSMSPEPTTPLGGVNLRPNSGRIKERNRAAQVLENQFTDEGIDEERLHRMLLELQDSSPCQSPSPVSSSSDPSSPTHLVPYDHMPIHHQSLSARSSRMYPVRRETVVVHGEVLVIRKLVVAGIVTAEKAYLDCLNVTKEFYRKPLLAHSSTSQAVISETDVNTIFYRVEDLHSLHSSLHEMLESLLPDWGMHSCVGGFFLELCKNLKLYKDYVEMYRRSLDCLERSKQDPNFKKFLDDVRVTVSSQNQFKDIPNVNELLRKPIERLQSYSLVLTDLCQHTPEAHNDFSVLKQSLNVMSDFIASTHDPRAFQQLSGGFNRELVKQELVVELLERSRKIRRLFLFHDVLVSAKEKSPSRHGEGVKLEPKWYVPLHNLRFHPPEAEALRPVPVTSDQELSIIKSRIAELKAQLNREVKEKRSSTLDKDASFKRNFKFIGTKPEKLRKKLQEQQVSYWIASPSLPLRLYSTSGKRYVFLLHNEDERESWISAIKKLQPKAVQSVTLSQFELQDLLCRQKVHLTRDQEEVIEVQTDEDEYLTGILRVHVTSAKDMKIKQNYGLHCALEFDEYSRFDRKARTLPVNMDMTTLMVTWDQDFEIETVGAHMMKAMIFYKYLLKEEMCAVGKLKLPVKELKSSKRCKVDVRLHPQGVLTLVVEYFTSIASMGKRPALLSSGVFGFPMDVVAKREHHDIPLIVQTCVDEVERRGLSEVGIYRVAGVLRDVQELRMAFDTDYIHAQQIAFETDIHAVAGLLKRYFRELPDPLFTDDLYMSFVQALALADPEAREQSLVTLLHSLPKVNFKTAVFLFKHLRNVAAESETNKMTLNNLATLFGPNLLRPGTNSQSAAAAFDVMSPVNVLMFFLICPLEVYDDPSASNSAPSSASKKSKKRQELLLEGGDTISVASSQSTGFVTPTVAPASSPSDTLHASSTPSLSSSSVVNPPSPSCSSTPSVNTPLSSSIVTPTTNVSTSSAPSPLRYKQSAI